MLSSCAKNSISEDYYWSKYVSPGGSPNVRNQNGSESEGLGFNLCVAPPRVIVSLILKGRGRIGDRRSEVGDDFVIMTRVGQG